MYWIALGCISLALMFSGAASGQGQVVRVPGTGGSITVGDIDGNPSVSAVTGIQFSNGAVTDNGDGTVQVATGVGGGGDASTNTATSVDSEIALFSGTGGNRTITSDPGTGSYDMSIYVHEFAGTHATPASGTPSTNSGSGTTSSTTNMTPADNDVLLLACDGHTASGTTTENQGSQGFTLSNEHESGSSAEPGSFVFKILSGAPGTPNHSWTVPSSTRTAGIAAYKPAVGAATPIRHRMTMD